VVWYLLQRIGFCPLKLLAGGAKKGQTRLAGCEIRIQAIGRARLASSKTMP
jgi:hypothetical protein